MITQQDVDFYKQNGYLLVKGVFNTVEIVEMRKAVDGIIERAAKAKRDANHQWQGDFLPPEELNKLVLKGFHDVQYHDAVFMRALMHPAIVSILTKVIGPNVQLHHSKMLVKPPERGAAFPFHQDHPYFPHRDHTMTAASVHLDDANDENGCIRVIPGSHLWGPIPHIGRHYLDAKKYPLDQGTPCEAKAGDVLFFNYLTVHGSYPNRSDRIRRNVLFQYRDAADPPVEDVHINWGQGLMVAGSLSEFKAYHPEFKLKA